MEFDFTDELVPSEQLTPALKRIGVFGSTGSIGKQTLENQ
jgi:hypothetical protein